MFTNASIFNVISNELNIYGSNNKGPSLAWCCNNGDCTDFDCDEICGWSMDPKKPDVPITAQACVGLRCAQRCKKKDGSWHDPGFCCDKPGTHRFYISGETGIEVVEVNGCFKYDGEGFVTAVVPPCEQTCGKFLEGME